MIRKADSSGTVSQNRIYIMKLRQASKLILTSIHVLQYFATGTCTVKCRVNAHPASCVQTVTNGRCIVLVPCTDKVVSECIRPWALTTHCACMYNVLRSIRPWAITSHQKLRAPSQCPPPFLGQSRASTHGRLLSTLQYVKLVTGWELQPLSMSHSVYGGSRIVMHAIVE